MNDITHPAAAINTTKGKQQRPSPRFNDATIFVIDIGASNTSWGYAGSDDPRQCYPSAWTTIPKQPTDVEENATTWSSRPVEFLELRENAQPLYCQSYNRLPSILQTFTKWGEEFSMDDDDNNSSPSQEQIKPSLTPDRLNADAVGQHVKYVDEFFKPCDTLKDRAVLFSEPTLSSPSSKYSRTLTELAVEKFEVAAVHVVRKAALGAVAFGRPTALVTETGPLGITISPVFEGYVLPTRSQQYAIGGIFMDWLLSTSLNLWDPAKGTFNDLFWPYSSPNKRGRSRVGPFSTDPRAVTNTPSGGMPASTDYIPKIDPLYLHYSRRRIVEDITMSCLIVREFRASALAVMDHKQQLSSQMGEVPNINVTSSADTTRNGGDLSPRELEDISYELPDGKVRFDQFNRSHLTQRLLGHIHFPPYCHRYNRVPLRSTSKPACSKSPQAAFVHGSFAAHTQLAWPTNRIGIHSVRLRY